METKKIPTGLIHSFLGRFLLESRIMAKVDRTTIRLLGRPHLNQWVDTMEIYGIEECVGLAVVRFADNPAQNSCDETRSPRRKLNDGVGLSEIRGKKLSRPGVFVPCNNFVDDGHRGKRQRQQL